MSHHQENVLWSQPSAISQPNSQSCNKGGRNRSMILSNKATISARTLRAEAQTMKTDLIAIARTPTPNGFLDKLERVVPGQSQLSGTLPVPRSGKIAILGKWTREDGITHRSPNHILDGFNGSLRGGDATSDRETRSYPACSVDAAVGGAFPVFSEVGNLQLRME